MLLLLLVCGLSALSVATLGGVAGVMPTRPPGPAESQQAATADRAMDPASSRAVVAASPAALGDSSIVVPGGWSPACQSAAAGAIPSAAASAMRPTTVAGAVTAARSPLRGGIAVFLGDSYTSGYVGAGLGANGWPAIVGASYAWHVHDLAVPGTGFVNPGWTDQPMRALLARTIRLHPGIVVVAGGHNDRKYAPSIVARAADAVLDQLHVALPGATLVVVGPIWQDGSPALSIVALRDHLRRKAAAMGALFIDPLRGGWFAGTAHRYIGPDGIHPTNAGHRHIAQLVLAALGRDPRFARPAPPAAVAMAPAPAAGPSDSVHGSRTAGPEACPG